MPDFSFYGASPVTGPKVFMTVNCHELRESLKKVWPNATTVLCIFHVLQQVRTCYCIHLLVLHSAFIDTGNKIPWHLPNFVILVGRGGGGGTGGIDLTL